MLRSKLVKIIFAALCGLIVGTVLFFPWEMTAEYSASKAAMAAAQKNICMSYSDIYTEGLLDRELICTGVTADLPAFSIKISEVRFDPSLIKSILSLSLRGNVYLGRGEITTVTRQKLKWTSGTAKLSVKNDMLYLDDLALSGDVTAKGYINLSMDTGKIANSDLTARFPHEFDRALQMLSTMQIINLTKVSPGEWRITR
jgi:hypothetical protein